MRDEVVDPEEEEAGGGGAGRECCGTGGSLSFFVVILAFNDISDPVRRGPGAFGVPFMLDEAVVRVRGGLVEGDIVLP